MNHKIKSLIPWLFISSAVAVLLYLGIWQIERLQWKEELMQQYEAAKLQPPMQFESIGHNELPNKMYQKVIARGEFIHQHEVHLGGQRWFGKTGYHILTPLKLAGSEENYVLVNRGWIPFELKEQEKRTTPLPEGIVEIQGVIRFPKEPRFFTPENHPEKNFWFSTDLKAMQQFTGLPLMPAIIEQTAESPDIDRFPIPSTGERVFRNDHLGYAITWFSLAIAAMVIFYLRIVRGETKTKPQDCDDIS